MINTKLKNRLIFLEKNIDYPLCFHPAKIKQGRNYINIVPSNGSDITTVFDIHYNLSSDNYLPNSSLVVRSSEIGELPKDFYKAGVQDFPFLFCVAKDNKIKMLQDISSVYRLHKKSSYMSLDSCSKINILIECIDILTSFFKKDENMRNKLFKLREKYSNMLSHL